MQELKLQGHAPTVRLFRKETQRVACPYCEGGYVEITAEHEGESMKIPGFHELHECVMCHKPFKLRPMVQVVGVKVEGV